MLLVSLQMPDFPSQISISATGRGFALADVSFKMKKIADFNLNNLIDTYLLFLYNDI